MVQTTEMKEAPGAGLPVGAAVESNTPRSSAGSTATDPEWTATKAARSPNQVDVTVDGEEGQASQYKNEEFHAKHSQVSARKNAMQNYKHRHNARKSAAARKKMTHGIEHVVVVMLENRSFDNIFGHQRDKAFLRGVKNSYDASTVHPAQTKFVPDRVKDPNGGEEYVDLEDGMEFGVEFQDHSYGGLESKFQPNEEPDCVWQTYLNQEGAESVQSTVEEHFKEHPNGPEAGISYKNGFCKGYVNAFMGRAQSRTLITNTYKINKDGDTTKSKYTRQPEDAMCCFHEHALPFFKHCASRYAILENYHTPCVGNTWPNRDTFLCGHSYGLTDNEIGFRNRYQLNLLTSAAGSPDNTKIYSPAAAISMAYLSTHGHNMFRSEDDFVADCATGALPKFSFLEPCYSYDAKNKMDGTSLHPYTCMSPASSQAYLLKLYNALQDNGLLEKTMMIITFDESGNCFDTKGPQPTLPLVSMKQGKFTKAKFKKEKTEETPYKGSEAMANHVSKWSGDKEMAGGPEETPRKSRLQSGKDKAKAVKERVKGKLYSADPTCFATTSARTPCVMISENPSFLAALEKKNPTGNAFYSVEPQDVKEPEKNNPYGVKKMPLDHVSLMHTVAQLLGTDLREKRFLDCHTPRLLQGATNIFEHILEGKFETYDVPEEDSCLPKERATASEFHERVTKDVSDLTEAMRPRFEACHAEIEGTMTQEHSLHGLQAMKPWQDDEQREVIDEDSKGAKQYLGQIQSSDTHIETLRAAVNSPGLTAVATCSCICGPKGRADGVPEAETENPNTVVME